MSIVTLYDDSQDLIIAVFWYPDNLIMLDKLSKYYQSINNNYWLGIKKSSLELH
jgi:hypothetical protein